MSDDDMDEDEDFAEDDEFGEDEVDLLCAGRADNMTCPRQLESGLFRQSRCVRQPRSRSTGFRRRCEQRRRHAHGVRHGFSTPRPISDRGDAGVSIAVYLTEGWGQARSQANSSVGRPVLGHIDANRSDRRLALKRSPRPTNCILRNN